MSSEDTLLRCLFRADVPAELRYIIVTQYLHSRLNNKTIREAIRDWCYEA